MPDARAIVERVADEYLGHHGVVEVSEGVRDGEPVVVLGVIDVDEAMRNIPPVIEGVRVVFEPRERPIPYAPAE